MSSPKFPEYEREINERIVDLERLRDGFMMKVDEYQNRIDKMHELKAKIKESHNPSDFIHAIA